jgi:hypothetical protein
MRDRRDYVIAALAAALLFCLGVLAGRQASVLPAAVAQDFDPEQPVNPKPGGTPPAKGGATIPVTPKVRPDIGGTYAPTASDSDSNNRFVAVTCPIGSGESVLFLLDSESEQLAVYRYERREGLEFLAGRKIDYDLRITGYQDVSRYTRDEMKAQFDREVARAAANAVKGK